MDYETAHRMGKNEREPHHELNAIETKSARGSSEYKGDNSSARNAYRSEAGELRPFDDLPLPD
jgi:hypothetical protein